MSLSGIVHERKMFSVPVIIKVRYKMRLTVQPDQEKGRGMVVVVLELLSGVREGKCGMP